MLGGDVERVEIVPVGFDLRPFLHAEAKFGEDRGDLFRHLADWVDRAYDAGAGRKSDVQPFGLQPLGQRGVGQRCLRRLDRGVQLILQGVQRGAGRLPLLRRHLAELAHPQADFALLAERGDARRL